MNDAVNRRKVEHVRLAVSMDESGPRPFETVRLRPRALPEIDLEEVHTTTRFLGKPLSFPLVIAAMTGGDAPLLRRINRNLARAAEKAGVALGLGSQRVMFTSPAARDSFAVRRWAPSAPVLANLGAVQLRKGFDIEHCRDAVEVAGADALCLHLNPLQEAIQPEGNTVFRGLAERMGGIATALDCPVLVKEVGSGLTLPDVKLLMAKGIRYFDVAGAGGTCWASIENRRREAVRQDDLGHAFKGWGMPTPRILQELSSVRRRIVLLASGGIRSGVDMVKAMVLGASLCAAAGPFLEPAMRSEQAVLNVIERFRREFRAALFLLGISEVGQVVGRADLLWSEEQRG